MRNNLQGDKVGRLTMVYREPTRVQKNFSIQPRIISCFERLVLNQKAIKGKKSTELIEEAIDLLLKKYGK